MPLVTVTVDGAARRRIAVMDGRVVCDDFKEFEAEGRHEAVFRIHKYEAN